MRSESFTKIQNSPTSRVRINAFRHFAWVLRRDSIQRKAPRKIPRCFSWQGQKDLNPRPLVLETSTLPTELYPCVTDTLYHTCSPFAIGKSKIFQVLFYAKNKGDDLGSSPLKLYTKLNLLRKSSGSSRRLLPRIRSPSGDSCQRANLPDRNGRHFYRSALSTSH